MTDKVEGEILKIYEGSRPKEENLFETSNVNHVAWTLALIFVLTTVWFGIALVHAENQRHAMASNLCPDQVFKEGFDQKCLLTVRSRDHWWEHLWYGVTHVRSHPDHDGRIDPRK